MKKSKKKSKIDEWQKKAQDKTLKPIKGYARGLQKFAEDAERLSALSGAIGEELRKLEESEAGGCLYLGGFHPAAALTRLSQEIADEIRNGLELILWNAGVISIAELKGDTQSVLEELDIDKANVPVKKAIDQK